MRRLMTFFRLPLCLAACALGLASCDETQEASAYDNWQERNEAFVDSLRSVAGEDYLTWNNPETRTITDIGTDGMEPGKLYALLVQDGGSTDGQQYVYCKKLVDNPEGERVLYSDDISVFMHVTYINGARLIYNFEGYGALDQEVPLKEEDMPWPTPFDEPATVSVGSDSRVPQGLRWVLQYARTGERWMVYVPYYNSVGYGESDSSVSGLTAYSSYATVLAYSALTYDVIVNEIVED